MSNVELVCHSHLTETKIDEEGYILNSVSGKENFEAFMLSFDAVTSGFVTIHNSVSPDGM